MFLVREPVDLELVSVQGSRPGGDKWTTAAAPSSSSHTVAADILFASWSLESGGGRWQLEEETRSRRGDCSGMGACSLRQRAVGKREVLDYLHFS